MHTDVMRDAHTKSDQPILTIVRIVLSNETFGVPASAGLIGFPCLLIRKSLARLVKSASMTSPVRGAFSMCMQQLAPCTGSTVPNPVEAHYETGCKIPAFFAGRRGLWAIDHWYVMRDQRVHIHPCCRLPVPSRCARLSPPLGFALAFLYP